MLLWRSLFCCMCLTLLLDAGESQLDPIEARWNAAVVKAGQVWQAAMVKMDAVVLREAERAAAAAARRNDRVAVIAAWSEALRIDRTYVKAREALTALGRLEDVLDALQGEGVDLLESGAPSSDDADLRRAIERRDKVVRDETARRSEAWSRADAAAMPDLERIAQRATGRGDAALARSAWYAVLRLSHDHVKAREYFTAAGQLAEVLAELEQQGDPRLSALGLGSLHGVAAAFVFNPRNIATQDGRLLVRDIAGGAPAQINGLANPPTQGWLVCDGNVTVEVPDASLVRVLPFTVACWFRPTAQSGNPGLIGDYIGSSWNGFMLQLEGPSIAAWMLRSHGNEVSICRELNNIDAVAWRPDAWQHAAASVDEKELVLYADGKLVMRQPWRGQSGPTNPTAPLLIGRYGSVYRGDIASVLFWRRALPPGEVAAVCAETAPVRRQ